MIVHTSLIFVEVLLVISLHIYVIEMIHFIGAQKDGSRDEDAVEPLVTLDVHIHHLPVQCPVKEDVVWQVRPRFTIDTDAHHLHRRGVREPWSVAVGGVIESRRAISVHAIIAERELHGRRFRVEPVHILTNQTHMCLAKRTVVKPTVVIVCQFSFKAVVAHRQSLVTDIVT
jgi:hypothetical protein